MNRQHDEQANPNAAMQFWEMIKPVLATLDEDQLDRLLAMLPCYYAPRESEQKDAA